MLTTLINNLIDLWVTTGGTLKTRSPGAPSKIS